MLFFIIYNNYNCENNNDDRLFETSYKFKIYLYLLLI